VRSLVQLHGGSVEAFSEGPGRGSEFVIRLPASAREKPRPQEARAAGHEVRQEHDGASALVAAAQFQPGFCLTPQYRSLSAAQEDASSLDNGVGEADTLPSASRAFLEGRERCGELAGILKTPLARRRR
jgi:hypothetical protein